MMSVVGDGIGTRARASCESVYKGRWTYSTKMKRKLRGGGEEDSEDEVIMGRLGC